MPLRYVDPNKKRGRGYAAIESFARSGPGQFVARHVFWRIDPWLYRVSGGRYPWIGMVTAPLMVSGLADWVIEALRNAIDNRPADPRRLAVGLLAVHAQLPVISSFMENSRYRQGLREMTFAAIEPILGLHQAIQNRLTDMRRSSIGVWG